MENQPPTQQAAAIPPLLNRNTFLTAMSSPQRWAILTAMCDGDSYCTSDLMPVTGTDCSTTSRHLGVLADAGLIERKGLRLYRIPRRFIPVPGQKILDYGHCLLRLDASAIG